VRAEETSSLTVDDACVREWEADFEAAACRPLPMRLRAFRDYWLRQPR